MQIKELWASVKCGTCCQGLEIEAEVRGGPDLVVAAACVKRQQKRHLMDSCMGGKHGQISMCVLEAKKMCF